MMKYWLSAFGILIGILLAATNGYKILAVFSMCARSHRHLGFSIAKELANRGHDVTFVNAYPEKSPIKNLREISVEEILVDMKGMVDELFDFGTKSYVGQLRWIATFGLKYTELVLSHPKVQELLNSNEEFDLVFQEHFMNEAMMIFPFKFKCPLVILAPGPTTVFNNHLVANPSPSSYVQNLISDFGSEMTFLDRVKNMYYDIVGQWIVHYEMLPKQNEVLRRTVADAPHLNKLLYNVSMMLLTSHVSISDPVPLQRNVKEIGGYHVAPAKPLAKDLQQFLDDAKDGVVLFSMGSNLKSSAFSTDQKKAILKAFSKIKQKVLWKFEDDLPEKPSNVKIMKWLPQNDVLAHPNVVAFIAHGGLLGTIEAVYHGVPILGLPVYWDQMKNMDDVVKKGFALKLRFVELNEQRFEKALTEILDNPKYLENAKKRSRILHDQPMTQLDEAVFWLEYVIRHKGAEHLKSPGLHLPWYQLYQFDVVLFVTVIILTMVSISYVILKSIKRSFSGCSMNSHIKKNN